MNKDEAKAILQETPQTPYEVLGLTPDATPEAIKKAFRQKIMQWHPDRNPDRKAEAEAMSRQLIAAYSLLTA
ncbi:MAG: J domain-containing protein [Sphingobacteriales bacterium]|nr:J domain-containing protein [Sphingobacteriales bacterium]